MIWLLTIAVAALAGYVWFLSLTVKGAHQRIDEWRDFTWRMERQIEELNQSQSQIRN